MPTHAHGLAAVGRRKSHCNIRLRGGKQYQAVTSTTSSREEVGVSSAKAAPNLPLLRNRRSFAWRSSASKVRGLGGAGAGPLWMRNNNAAMSQYAAVCWAGKKETMNMSNQVRNASTLRGFRYARSGHCMTAKGLCTVETVHVSAFVKG